LKIKNALSGFTPGEDFRAGKDSGSRGLLYDASAGLFAPPGFSAARTYRSRIVGEITFGSDLKHWEVKGDQVPEQYTGTVAIKKPLSF